MPRWSAEIRSMVKKVQVRSSPSSWSGPHVVCRYRADSDSSDASRGVCRGHGERETDRIVAGVVSGPDSELWHWLVGADFAARRRLPTMFAFREAPDDGGLMSYGVSTAASYRRAATFVDKILKGAKPGDLPI